MAMLRNSLIPRVYSASRICNAGALRTASGHITRISGTNQQPFVVSRGVRGIATSIQPRIPDISDKSTKKYAPYEVYKPVEQTRSELPEEVQELVKEYPSLTVFPVKWGEMDSFQHVNNVSYARYVETGRTEYFEQVFHKHISDELFRQFRSTKAVGPIVKSVMIKYRAPVVHPDVLTVAVVVPRETIQSDRFIQKCIIVSHTQKKIVAESDTVIVTVDYRTGKKALIPDFILEAYEKGNFPTKN